MLSDKNDHLEQNIISTLSKYSHEKRKTKRENRYLWAHRCHKCFGILLLYIALNI